eukprot:1666457-Prymnesium_polylepis.2
MVGDYAIEHHQRPTKQAGAGGEQVRMCARFVGIRRSRATGSSRLGHHLQRGARRRSFGGTMKAGSERPTSRRLKAAREAHCPA